MKLTDGPRRPESEGLLSRRHALSILALTYPMRVAMERETESPGNIRLDSETLRKLVPSLGARARDALLEALKDSSLRGQIPASEVESMLGAEHKTVDELMVDLLPVAQLYSEPSLSNFRVGAVVRGTSGGLYLGANIEVPHQVLGFSVHAEQSAVSNAFMHDDRGLACLAVTAAPCGHCRQFLNELPNAPELKLLVTGSSPTTLRSLLPQPFGPKDLEVTDRLFSGKKADLELISPVEDELASAALEAASRSYAPYTKARSGIAVKSTTKTVYKGSYIENAAFNPSLSPLQAALVGLIMGGEKPAGISSAVLVELENAPISQKSATRAVLEAIAPAASLRCISARLKP